MVLRGDVACPPHWYPAPNVCRGCTRDLKPANILVYVGPLSRPVFKLGDFGYSKSTDARGRLKSVLGTAEYSAPEVQCSTA